MINLNEQQLQNLNVFLSRVDLKGAEVGAFNELVGIFFNKPNQTELPKETKEEVEVEEGETK